MISPGNPELVALLRQKIAESGPLSFADFMHLALYAPGLGYYSSGLRPVGRKGDFYTSVSVGRLFGRLLAGQFYEIWNAMDRPSPFYLVEQGAHHGQLAADVLASIREKYPLFQPAVRYLIIEPSPALQAAQQNSLTAAGLVSGVEWIRSAAEEKGRQLTGVYFSNELPDSFPVHLVRFTGGSWRELKVSWNPGDDAPAFMVGDSMAPGLQELIRHWQIPEMEGYSTELCLGIKPWMESVHGLFSRAVWLTIDYGWTADEYYHPSRSQGTLLCYSEHQSSDTPLSRIGQQDITAHANFTQIIETGEALGLRTLGLTDQHHAMIGLASDTLMKECSECELTPERMRDLRLFKSLSHPEMMGRSFRFLVQTQNWTPPLKLSVLKFDRG